MDIKIGTSGFSFDDWIGTIYPQDIKKNDMLGYYEKELGFSVVEVNYTHHVIPHQKAVADLSKKTSDSFGFVVKAYKKMTHQIYDKEKNEIIDRIDIINKFKYALEPLIAEGKLKCVLAQFPHAFFPTLRNVDYLKYFSDLMGSIPVTIEFRNVAWHNDTHTNFLKNNNLGYCVVDEPAIKGLMPFRPKYTTNMGYFRFHGRNKNWFNSHLSKKNDYLYSKNELQGFVKPLTSIADRTKSTVVFFNNSANGSAVKNARAMIELLKD